MHGGAKGSGGPAGERNGQFKHGLYTREAKTIRRVMREKVREIKALVQAANPPPLGLIFAIPVLAGGAPHPAPGACTI